MRRVRRAMRLVCCVGRPGQGACCGAERSGNGAEQRSPRSAGSDATRVRSMRRGRRMLLWVGIGYRMRVLRRRHVVVVRLGRRRAGLR